MGGMERNGWLRCYNKWVKMGEKWEWVSVRGLQPSKFSSLELTQIELQPVDWAAF